MRVDSYAYGGYVVPSHYDSMIGKFIAFGDLREQTLSRMRLAQRELVVEGIDTTIPLQPELLANPVFCQGGAGIHHLEEWIASRRPATH